MTSEREPMRWRDAPDPELPAELRAAFAGYAATGPSPALKERMGEQLTRAVAQPAPRAWLRAWKVWLGGALLLAAAWGGLRGAPTQGAPADVTLPALELAAAPEPAVHDEPAAAALAEVPAVTAPAVAPPARRKRVHESAPRPAPAAELALLVPARKLVAVDAARALALAEQHAREHARGAFAEEREVIAAEALVRLGRAAEARARVSAFAAAHPHSTHLPHLRELTGDE